MIKLIRVSIPSFRFRVCHRTLPEKAAAPSWTWTSVWRTRMMTATLIWAQTNSVTRAAPRVRKTDWRGKCFNRRPRILEPKQQQLPCSGSTLWCEVPGVALLVCSLYLPSSRVSVDELMLFHVNWEAYRLVIVLLMSWTYEETGSVPARCLRNHFQSCISRERWSAPSIAIVRGC